VTDAPRVLIVRLTSLGDVVWALPGVTAIREALPKAFIGLAVERKFAALVEGHPHVDKLHVIPRIRAKAAFLPECWRAVRELRAQRYDVAIDFQSNARAAFWTRLAGARRVIGQPRHFAKEGAWHVEREHPTEVLPPWTHKVDRNIALLSLIGVKPAKPPRPIIPEPAVAAEFATSWVAGGKRPLVLVHPHVSDFWNAKLWREEAFAELGRRLAARGARVCVTWGTKDELPRAERIVALAKDAVELAPDLSSFARMAAVFKRADLVVACDTGPLHIASAVGVKVLGLYGPTDPRIYSPYWDNTRYLRKGVPCSPCRLKKCPRTDCMMYMTADQVFVAAKEILDEVGALARG
jgi:lipopolysaccharide heptosyltransferase I